MKLLLLAAVLAATTITVPVFAADVGMSVSIGQPGFFGRIDIGDYPQPQLIYRQPRVVERVPMNRQPVYLHVRPGQERNWRRHCREYNACGERVYFVQDNWYSHEYVPRYQQQHRDRRDERGDGRRGDQNDRHGNDRGYGPNR
ncbi:MAG: hypothetical protein ABL892_09135 [Thiobacillaceae bacterium]